MSVQMPCVGTGLPRAVGPSIIPSCHSRHTCASTAYGMHRRLRKRVWKGVCTLHAMHTSYGRPARGTTLRQRPINGEQTLVADCTMWCHRLLYRSQCPTTTQAEIVLPRGPPAVSECMNASSTARQSALLDFSTSPQRASDWKGAVRRAVNTPSCPQPTMS
jgi:hypothetical protein